MGIICVSKKYNSRISYLLSCESSVKIRPQLCISYDWNSLNRYRHLSFLKHFIWMLEENKNRETGKRMRFGDRFRILCLSHHYGIVTGYGWLSFQWLVPKDGRSIILSAIFLVILTATPRIETQQISSSLQTNINPTGILFSLPLGCQSVSKE